MNIPTHEIFTKVILHDLQENVVSDLTSMSRECDSNLILGQAKIFLSPSSGSTQITGGKNALRPPKNADDRLSIVAASSCLLFCLAKQPYILYIMILPLLLCLQTL
jgi:hypothetical protein